MPDTSPGLDPADSPPLARLGWRAEFRLAAAFLTRVPIPLGAAEAGHGLASAVRAFPLVGLVLGAFAGAVYTLADLLGIGSTVAALLAFAVMALATGGLHEDGLADTADGFGGGRTRAEKLEIMHDSRIGTFGVLALIFAVSLRVTALSYTGGPGDTLLGQATLLMVAAAAGSRACMPAVMYLLPRARRDGLAWHAGTPERARVVDAGTLGVIIVIICLGPIAGLAAVAAAALATTAMGLLARRQIGGHTGDVLGAVQQVSEIAILLAFLSVPIL
jgi:adenosylcobinamide-GDP ribazoletransferase